jgi:ribosomal protein S18 acetylase RimI-like enzyme
MIRPVEAPNADVSSRTRAAVKFSPDLRPLDNPIWHALNTEHRSLALGSGPARSYPVEIGPLSATVDQSGASYEALRALAGPERILGLFLEKPSAPSAGWTLLRDGPLNQMIRLSAESPAPPRQLPKTKLRRLTPDDVSAMVELAELTEPGPFRRRTFELGVFFGIFDAGRLLAMAGQRLHLPHFVEVSAVCTHPDARGRGYARALMSAVVEDIRQRGKTPFLHVLPENYGAIRVYESLGFKLRRTLHLAIVRNEL